MLTDSSSRAKPIFVLPGLRAVQWFLLGIALTTLLNVSLQARLSLNSKPLNIPKPAMDLRPTFVLFGDSLTQQSFRPGGWGAQLADKYARKADVVLRGYSGYNSRWALYLLEKVFPKTLRPALVTVFLGANDAALPDRGASRQHVPVAEYAGNLKRIVQHVKTISSSTQVMLITPPPVDEAAREVHARETYGPLAPDWLSERTNEVTGKYAEACKKLGQELGLPVVDLYNIFQQQTDWRSLLSDGLHFNQAGNDVAFQSMLSTIEQLKEPRSLRSDDLPWDFPEHSDIDHQYPDKTFTKSS